MDRKIAGIGIGVVLALSLVAIMGLAFAGDSGTTEEKDVTDADDDGICSNADDCEQHEQAGFEDTDGDGICDHAGDCPRHQENGGCHGSGGCPHSGDGAKGGCHRMPAME